MNERILRAARLNRKMRGEGPPEPMPFGEFIRSYREQAEIIRKEAAERAAKYATEREAARKSAQRKRRWFYIAAAAGLLIGATAFAETIDGTSVIIIDGDTIALPCTGEIRKGCAERVRILNIDAPETRGAVCEAERIAGLEAKARLAALLRGQPVNIERCEGDTGRCADRYGRTLARLSTSTGDIGQALISSGHALPWQPGAAAKFTRQQHWCGARP